MGKLAYRQSIYPYKREPYNNVAIVGLDTEFYFKDGINHLATWQLGLSNGKNALYMDDINKTAMVDRSIAMLGKVPEHLIFVTYFIIAEAQFFVSPEWTISEYKGKYRFHAKHGKLDVQVIDIGNWYPREKLSSVAELHGLKKQDYPIVEVMQKIADGKLTVKKLVATDKKFVQYAVNDSIITAKIAETMRSFYFQYGVDIAITQTAAGTSAAVFRKHYVPEPITQFNVRLRKLAMLACWGGRTECFYRGEHEKCIEYDAFAHHPSSAICIGELPNQKDWRRVTNVKDLLSGRGGLAHISFKYPKGEEYPCLPVYDDGNLLFPLEGDSKCSSYEIQLALESGARITILDGYSFDHGNTYLQDYLLWLRSLREKTTNDVESRLLKLMMNSIIGKLFQKSVEGYDLNAANQFAFDHGIPINVAIATIGLPIKKTTTVGSCFYPEWYALVIGYARANISRLARQHKAIMVSSDSLIVPHKITKFNDDIKYAIKGKGHYLGYRCKLYRLGSKLAHHGVHNKAMAEKMLATYMADEADDILYDVKHITLLREAWKAGTPMGINIKKQMEVSLLYDYKRKLLKSGYTVPWKNIKERRDFLCH